MYRQTDKEMVTFTIPSPFPLGAEGNNLLKLNSF